ncbi:hypothetical protein OIU77_020329 [Salix suchowensis]|uniref:F-box domain-containing protein n=1 Tax=Salix suchowensis TaxID=1278906 RepID=A0ABQ9CK92_9ROSI|nr:hypothetical protein OIU77_020329 [Salix suchowensis]
MALLLRERSRKAQRRNGEGMDRFWNLPEPIIDHVFSFLEMDDMARIGVVSKRLTQMFDPIPHQKFESKCFYDGPPDSCNQFFAWTSIAATITVMQI